MAIALQSLIPPPDLLDTEYEMFVRAVRANFVSIFWARAGAQVKVYSGLGRGTSGVIQ